jgi:DNA-3-methyladenine glycosylase II
VSRFALPLPRGYRADEVLGFYGRDAEGVSEQAFPGGLRKALLVDDKPVEVTIEFHGDSAKCQVDGAGASEVRHAVLRMLGLTADASVFEDRFADDPLIGAIVRRQIGLRIPLTPEPWEALAWAIMGQQISVHMAVILRRELIRAAGLPMPMVCVRTRRPRW